MENTSVISPSEGIVILTLAAYKSRINDALSTGEHMSGAERLYFAFQLHSAMNMLSKTLK